MNILSFDIEEWYLENQLHGGRAHKFQEFESIRDYILDLLDEHNIKATFFCLGKLASEYPHVVKMIANHGHEIGCHSNAHLWVNKMTPEEFLKDTHEAIDALENVIGEKVISYRAPAFSIGEDNKWAFEILAECGIINDSSVFPGVRDLGGLPSFTHQTPVKIQYNNIEINEFPIPLHSFSLIGKKLAFSGGGYFRLLPYWLVKKWMKTSDYNMCYFHIADLSTQMKVVMSRKEFEYYYKVSGSLKNRYFRFLKSNIGRSSTLKNFTKLISDFSFTSISDYIQINIINSTHKV